MCHPSFSSSGLSVVDLRERWGGGMGAGLFAWEEEDGFGCLGLFLKGIPQTPYSRIMAFSTS